MSAATVKVASGSLPIRSDVLRPLRSLLASNAGLAHFTGVFQIRLVVDANQVLADIRWLVKKRETPGARTTLQEVIDAGTAVVFAPEWIDEEVRKHAPRFADEAGVTEEMFLATWEHYRGGLRLYKPRAKRLATEATEVADPKDLPYVDLCFEVGAAAVYSEDSRHLTAMGVRVVKKEYLSDLRTYSRAEAINLTITVGGSTAIVVSAKSAYTLVRWVYGLLKRLTDLPREIKFLALLAGLILVIHPGARVWATRKLEQISPILRQLVQTLGPTVARLLNESFEAQKNARAALERARSTLPVSPRYQLRTHILAVLIAAERPLTVREIVRDLRAAGCRARSKKINAYIARSLASDDRVMRAGRHRWTVCRAEG